MLGDGYWHDCLEGAIPQPLAGTNFMARANTSNISKTPSMTSSAHNHIPKSTGLRAPGRVEQGKTNTWQNTSQVKEDGGLWLIGSPHRSASRGLPGKKCHSTYGLSLEPARRQTHSHAYSTFCPERRSRPWSQLLSPASGRIASIWPVTLARATVAFLICQRVGAILWLSRLICSRRLEETHTNSLLSSEWHRLWFTGVILLFPFRAMSRVQRSRKQPLMRLHLWYTEHITGRWSGYTVKTTVQSFWLWARTANTYCRRIRRKKWFWLSRPEQTQNCL